MLDTATTTPAADSAPHTAALRLIAHIIARPGVLDFNSAITRLTEIKAIALDALQQTERAQ